MNTKDFIKKVAEFNSKEIDLSSGEDLSIALMNLVSLEEHAYFSFIKTGNPQFLELLGKTREIRKRHLKKIVASEGGEEWCMSKHLLASSMRLIETGNKFYSQKNTGDAEELYADAFELYSMFWQINIGKKRFQENAKTKSSTWFSQSLKKMLDCCKE